MSIDANHVSNPKDRQSKPQESVGSTAHPMTGKLLRHGMSDGTMSQPDTEPSLPRRQTYTHAWHQACYRTPGAKRVYKFASREGGLRVRLAHRTVAHAMAKQLPCHRMCCGPDTLLWFALSVFRVADMTGIHGHVSFLPHTKIKEGKPGHQHLLGDMRPAKEAEPEA